MAVDMPTPEEFMARFPQFDGQDDQVEVALNEAARSVGETWIANDQKDAIMYLAAHLMTEEAQYDGSSGGGPIASESFGPISVSYASPSSANDGYLATTIYGKRFIRLRKRSFPGIAVV